MTRTVKLIISLVLPLAAGAIGSIFTSGAIETWYLTLNKPSFTPPDWLFGPVWTLLFLLMGIALYLIWSFDPAAPKLQRGEQAQDKQKEKSNLVRLFIFHLIINALWSIVFFGLHEILLAFIVIILLLLFVW